MSLVAFAGQTLGRDADAAVGWIGHDAQMIDRKANGFLIKIVFGTDRNIMLFPKFRPVCRAAAEVCVVILRGQTAKVGKRIGKHAAVCLVKRKMGVFLVARGVDGRELFQPQRVPGGHGQRVAHTKIAPPARDLGRNSTRLAVEEDAVRRVRDGVDAGLQRLRGILQHAAVEHAGVALDQMLRAAVGYAAVYAAGQRQLDRAVGVISTAEAIRCGFSAETILHQRSVSSAPFGARQRALRCSSAV